MNDLKTLACFFEESSIRRLEELFEKANHGGDETQTKILREELFSILRREKRRGGFMCWKASPNEENHIIVVDSSCFWLSVHGVKLLFESLLFLEGELALENFRWTERDNLVVFDLYYIVHNERDKCICHFARDDFFAYIAPERKKLF